MSEDGRLLRQYREQGSEAAFARLAARHLNFVYATCLRETGDAALAEDAAQVVFLLLARKAPAPRPEHKGRSLTAPAHSSELGSSAVRVAAAIV